jgi:hypothetical protein
MVLTTILNAVSLGTTTELKNSSPTKTVLAVGTTGVCLTVKIIGKTNVSANQSTMIRVWAAISPTSYTADATLPSHLFPQADLIEVKVPQGNSMETTVTFPESPRSAALLANNGGNLYTWFDSPALAYDGSAAPTITLTSVELP